MIARARWLASLLLVIVIACDAPSDRLPAPDSTPAATGMTPLAIDERGLPRLLQAVTSQAAPAAPAAPAATASESARFHLGRIASAWKIAPGAMPVLEPAGEIAVRGGTIARIGQQIDGMPIEGGELRLLVRPSGALVTASGTLIGTDTPRNAPAYRDDDAGAIARAVGAFYGIEFDARALSTSRASSSAIELLGGRAGGIEVAKARARKLWHRSGNRLIAAWLIEVYANKPGSTTGDAFRTVISDDGRVLSQRSLIDDAFGYRVFAEPTGENHPSDGPLVDPSPHPTGIPNGLYPAFIAPSLVTVDGLNHPAGGLADPWLPVGATETLGNNVDAYVDLTFPDGLSAGDFRASVTAPGVFDRSYNTALGPLTSQPQQMAGITSLFYNLNWLHDFWYDAGFTETAGNGQASNYGRGGIEGDVVIGEAQDNATGGSRNNANMATPGDGMSPRMQVFLWSGTDDHTMSVAGQPRANKGASFGPASFDVTAGVVLANDGTDPVSDACGALTNVVTGKIVVVDRGACSFKAKSIAVQNAGGVGMILVDNVAATNPPTLGGDDTIMATVTIGSMSVTLADGTAIKTAVGTGPTAATMHRLAGVELEGAIDSTLVAHEFGHYLHHRLQSCNTTMCGALSEGWGDFSALMLMAREGDDLDGAYPFSVYTTPSFSDDPAYFGIRRAPYSVNQAVNSLSFRHMAAGEALPTTHPFLAFGNNAEVHNAGEVWASAMWEAYVALQHAGTSFDETRQKMAEYVVAGLLLAPEDGTPTETRDAILAAAFAGSPADQAVMAAAFARRGLGSCAVSPPRNSADFLGIVESTEVRGRAVVGATTFTDSVVSCDDDGVLDDGETARIRVPVTNPGPETITDVNVTLGSPTAGVTIVSQPAPIATMPPYTTIELELDVQLDDTATEAVDGELSLVITATGSCDATLTTPFKIRMNVDEVFGSSATDSFDSAASVWTPQNENGAGWTTLQETALDGLWHGADLGIASDTSLASPILRASDSDPLVVTFTHRYSFEFSDDTAFDGGVIEYAVDGLATWSDITTLGIAPGYSATPLTDQSGNPLAGSPAFTGDSPSYPGTDVVTLDFGTQLAGRQFQLRFRIGTDGAAGGPGWEIDDVAFSGIVGTPFPTVVPDNASCQGSDDGGDGGCCDAGPLRAGNVLAGLGVLGLLLRRRRPR